MSCIRVGGGRGEGGGGMRKYAMQQICGNNKGKESKRVKACLLHMCAALDSEMGNGTILPKE